MVTLPGSASPTETQEQSVAVVTGGPEEPCWDQRLPVCQKVVRGHARAGFMHPPQRSAALPVVSCASRSRYANMRVEEEGQKLLEK